MSKKTATETMLRRHHAHNATSYTSVYHLPDMVRVGPLEDHGDLLGQPGYVTVTSREVDWGNNIPDGCEWVSRPVKATVVAIATSKSRPNLRLAKIDLKSGAWLVDDEGKALKYRAPRVGNDWYELVYEPGVAGHELSDVLAAQFGGSWSETADGVYEWPVPAK